MAKLNPGHLIPPSPCLPSSPCSSHSCCNFTHSIDPRKNRFIFSFPSIIKKNFDPQISTSLLHCTIVVVKLFQKKMHCLKLGNFHFPFFFFGSVRPFLYLRAYKQKSHGSGTLFSGLRKVWDSYYSLDNFSISISCLPCSWALISSCKIKFRMWRGDWRTRKSRKGRGISF